MYPALLDATSHLFKRVGPSVRHASSASGPQAVASVAEYSALFNHKIDLMRMNGRETDARLEAVDPP